MSGIRNIGPTSAEWLAAVGVESMEDLARTGAVEAYRRVKSHLAIEPAKVSLNLLWALQGALMELHWTDVPDALRQQLLAELGGRDGC